MLAVKGIAAKTLLGLGVAFMFLVAVAMGGRILLAISIFWIGGVDCFSRRRYA
jgi:hypothetical protein